MCKRIAFVYSVDNTVMMSQSGVTDLITERPVSWMDLATSDLDREAFVPESIRNGGGQNPDAPPFPVAASETLRANFQLFREQWYIVILKDLNNMETMLSFIASAFGFPKTPYNNALELYNMLTRFYP